MASWMDDQNLVFYTAMLSGKQLGAMQPSDGVPFASRVRRV
jgi:hypothetical protein